MLGEKRGDYLLPMVFFEKDIYFHFRAVILNINPEGCLAVTNDRTFLEQPEQEMQQKDFVLQFNFFDLDTRDIKGRIQRIRPGLFKGHEVTLDFRFTTINTITRRDINRIIQAQRLY